MSLCTAFEVKKVVYIFRVDELKCLYHLVDNQPDLLPVDLLLPRLLLQQVKQRLMHQLEDQKYLLVMLETV